MKIWRKFSKIKNQDLLLIQKFVFPIKGKKSKPAVNYQIIKIAANLEPESMKAIDKKPSLGEKTIFSKQYPTLTSLKKCHAV